MGSSASVDQGRSQKRSNNKGKKPPPGGSGNQQGRRSGNGHIPNKSNENGRRSNPRGTSKHGESKDKRRLTDPLPIRSKHHNRDVTVSKSSEKNRTANQRGTKVGSKGSFPSGKTKKSRNSTKTSSEAKYPSPSKCSSTLRPTSAETSPSLQHKSKLNNVLKNKLNDNYDGDKVIQNNFTANQLNDKNKHMLEKVQSFFDFEKMNTLLSLSSTAAYKGRPEQYEESKLLKDVDLVNWHKEEELR